MRKNKKLSQEQVASVADMARPDISRFESGRYNPSLELMICIFASIAAIAEGMTILGKKQAK